VPQTGFERRVMRGEPTVELFARLGSPSSPRRGNSQRNVGYDVRRGEVAEWLKAAPC
jgi:hypothetical protein